jgi:hypothetical protein
MTLRVLHRDATGRQMNCNKPQERHDAQNGPEMFLTAKIHYSVREEQKPDEAERNERP